MLKKILVFTAFLFTALSVSASDFVRMESSVDIESGSYVLEVNAYDFGPGADRIIMNLGRTVIAPSVLAEDFEVNAVWRSSNPSDTTGIVRGQRTVTDAYISDASGNRISDNLSRYVTIVMKVGPEEDYSSPFVSSKMRFFEVDDIYGYRIKNDKLKISIQKCSGIISPSASAFTVDEYSYDNVSISFSSWKPESVKSGRKIPLIIWFHGMGESGSNPYSALLGTKATALAGSKIQSYFKDGAAVLVPQCPTGWMETTETDFTGNRIWAPVDITGTVNKAVSPVTNFFNKFITNTDSSSYPESTEAVSYYTYVIKSLIDSYIMENPEIDSDRIYIGGCSAGGYMTLNMLFQYPDFFAAAFPVCEAYPDSRISDSMIENIRELPLWFVVADNDDTIEPSTHTYVTVERLRSAGAKNLHLAVFEDVHDTSGLYFDSDGKEPYQYSGHYSWIYVLNDEVYDGGTSLFEWLSAQHRN